MVKNYLIALIIYRPVDIEGRIEWIGGGTSIRIAIGILGIIKDCGLLVNSSRGIIYASNGEDFAETAGIKAKELQEQMAEELAKLS